MDLIFWTFILNDTYTIFNWKTVKSVYWIFTDFLVKWHFLSYSILKIMYIKILNFFRIYKGACCNYYWGFFGLYYNWYLIFPAVSVLQPRTVSKAKMSKKSIKNFKSLNCFYWDILELSNCKIIEEKMVLLHQDFSVCFSPTTSPTRKSFPRHII